MKYKILQIKNLRDCDYSFDGWKWAKDKFNIDDYEEVYHGEKEGDNPFAVLEDLFVEFNINHPIDFRGHSLSVSDVVELDGKHYYCDSCGWVEINGGKE